MATNQPQLGKLLTSTDGAGDRDAIHFALFSATCPTYTLIAGQKVDLVPGKQDEVAPAAANGIGIVDPFLTDLINPGERFYVMLYMNTITDLKHVWKHPAFKEPEKKFPMTKSEIWIREFAQSHGLEYDELMVAAADFLDNGEYLCKGGDLEGQYVPEEFWDHFTMVLGRRVPKEQRQNFFTCSC